jgi:hypothetical protein
MIVVNYEEVNGGWRKARTSHLTIQNLRDGTYRLEFTPTPTRGVESIITKTFTIKNDAPEDIK